MSSQYCSRSKNFGQRCGMFCNDTPCRFHLFHRYSKATSNPAGVYLYCDIICTFPFTFTSVRIGLTFRKKLHKCCKMQSRLKFKGRGLFLRGHFYIVQCIDNVILRELREYYIKKKQNLELYSVKDNLI